MDTLWTPLNSEHANYPITAGLSNMCEHMSQAYPTCTYTVRSCAQTTPWIKWNGFSGYMSLKSLQRMPAALSVRITRETENVKSREHTIPLWVHLSASAHTRGSNVCMHVWGASSSVGYTDWFEHTQGGGGDRDLVTQQQKQQIINVGEVNAWWFRFTTAGRRTGGRVIIRMVSRGTRPCEKHFPWCPWAHVIKKKNLKYNETQKVWTITGKKM